MLINQADMIYFGNQEVDKVYLGSQLVWERLEDGAINVIRISQGQYEINPVMKAGQNYDIVINGEIDYIRVTYTDETEEMFSGFSDGIPYSITPMNDIKLIKVYKNYSFFDPESIVIVEEESAVSEPTFTLRGGHNGKQQQSSYISVNKQYFTNYGVDPSAVTAITVNDRKYNVTRFLEFSVAIYFYIENADTLELDGSETLTFHY